jgi:hypothetical protein
VAHPNRAIAHHIGGLGLTPQCASGIAAFYHSIARFVGWMAQMDAPERWLGSAQKLDQQDTWTESNLVALKHTHHELCQEYSWVEGVQDPPANVADSDADGACARADGDCPRPATFLLSSATLPSCFTVCLGRQGSLQAASAAPCHFASDEPLGAAQGHRRQRSQCLQRHLDVLHQVHALDAISRKACEPCHSILRSDDVPGGEEIDCEPSMRRKYATPLPTQWVGWQWVHGERAGALDQ